MSERNSLALAVGSRLADEAEVVAQQCRGEELHELDRRPQLHLKHNREVAVVAEARQVPARQPAQPLAGIGEVGHDGPALGEPFAHAALEDRDQQIVLALEVEVDRAGGDAGGARDIGDLSVEIPALGEDINRSAKDRVTFRSRRGVGFTSDRVERHTE